MIRFHGGCEECTQQEQNGVRFCKGCQYFAADWQLPNLNNRPSTKAELVRKALQDEPALEADDPAVISHQ